MVRVKKVKESDPFSARESISARRVGREVSWLSASPITARKSWKAGSPRSGTSVAAKALAAPSDAVRCAVSSARNCLPSLPRNRALAPRSFCNSCDRAPIAVVASTRVRRSVIAARSRQRSATTPADRTTSAAMANAKATRT